MRLNLQAEQEADGRWLVEVVEWPGCIAYGETLDAARRAAVALALRTLADRVEHGEVASHGLVIRFIGLVAPEPHAFGLARRILVRGEPVSETIVKDRG